ncbi:hypothetical protein [Gordonia bronchialis]|uniref:hypothetical protein n=1 Tax=Gordonia bronchialis TaxID=2054 RepID=UPI00242BEBD0|nr:hypothetical protein [Gordonia bronchialis]
MSNYLPLPSVYRIRQALEGVPDAIRDEPQSSPAGSGGDRASEIWVNSPEDPPDTFVSFPIDGSDAEDENDVVDSPHVAFEIPPEVTDADISDAMGEDRLSELQQQVQFRGVDALGWYVTFHQRRAQHGVHIPIEGVVIFARQAFSHLKISPERKLTLAFHAILRHELFHFATDCMIANWELATGHEVFWTAKAANRNEAGYVELEEALANAYMLRGFRYPTRQLAQSPGAYSSIQKFCRMQPSGYDAGPEYARSRRSYLEGCRRLSADYHHSSEPSWRAPSAFDHLIFYPDLTRIDWTRCPIVIQDGTGILAKLNIGVSSFSKVTNLQETQRFQRSLRKLDGTVRSGWTKRKALLERTTAFKSLDFKQWEKRGKDWYSVRVVDGFRAHLRYDGASTEWWAEEIGDHKSLGHG